MYSVWSDRQSVRQMSLTASRTCRKVSGMLLQELRPTTWDRVVAKASSTSSTKTTISINFNRFPNHHIWSSEPDGHPSSQNSIVLRSNYFTLSPVCVCVYVLCVLCVCFVLCVCVCCLGMCCVRVCFFTTQNLGPYINLLAPELFFFNFSTPVHKMWIIQEPNMLELWNKLHFEEEKTESIYRV